MDRISIEADKSLGTRHEFVAGATMQVTRGTSMSDVEGVRNFLKTKWPGYETFKKLVLQDILDDVAAKDALLMTDNAKQVKELIG